MLDVAFGHVREGVLVLGTNTHACQKAQGTTLDGKDTFLPTPVYPFLDPKCSLTHIPLTLYGLCGQSVRVVEILEGSLLDKSVCATFSFLS